ncbi:hypothetical protein ACWD4V_28165 [Streptomyces tsukubensis]|uniref:hypothetical protein n=1 Tax=Streptomyces tsukubensis TaxID=83656 RepID=UPI0036A336F8
MRHLPLLRGVRVVRLLLRLSALVLRLVRVPAVALVRVLRVLRLLLGVRSPVPLGVPALDAVARAVRRLTAVVLLLVLLVTGVVVLPAGVLLVLLLVRVVYLLLVLLLGLLLVRVLDSVGLLRPARVLLVLLLLTAGVGIMAGNGLRSLPLVAVERVVGVPRFGAGAPAILSH